MKTFIKLVTDIMGTKIKTPEGEDVGVVQNIMIDPRNGTIIYIVLCYANFMGKTHRHFAIPRQMVTLKNSEQAVSYLEIDKEELLNVRGIFPGGWSLSKNPECIYELLPDKPQHARAAY